ncbi:hypothetical protein DOTSEDRAFT_71790 [Dothistroma septosporum NZE10]|uniref:Bromo domain-containing protein n=1 Tax=Dothistroma septosporum (strain NZE10 / CBS 128990) TaxID=675120 RepID=N1PLB0_DOTSN|nr:hypothetical protein DOTSEDRAFT_71790 [Dothistroma septosporum NZE10]
MASALKRKASNATPTALEGASSSKKIKLLNSTPKHGSPPDVQKIGYKLLEYLNRATDKTGHEIAGAFLELPPRDELPDYYQQIKLPVALDIIEDKLNRNAYPTVTTLESDLKRMIQNAKDYNLPKSEVYEDAERIRKLVYNYMKQHNPAYNDPSYTSFATPIPDGPLPIPTLRLTNGAARQSEAVKHESESRDDTGRPRQSAGPKASGPLLDRKSSAAPSAAPTAGDADDESMDFTGKSFQEAQEMIIKECIRYTDEDGEPIFFPFVNLPSRKLEDYYKVIRHPVCLKMLQKRINGIHGRAPPTGVTDYKTWDAFEEETSFIWRNARDYNEDGSEMYKLAGELEEHFKSRLAEAKEKVEEPALTRIKLGGPKPPQAAPKSGITLNLAHHRNSPTPGVSVDNEALARQRAMVSAGVNGQQQTQSQPAPQVNGMARSTSQLSHTDAPRPLSNGHAMSPPAAAVKYENMSTLSPGPAPSTAAPATHHITNGMMPPPVMRPTSNSPYPTTQGHPGVTSYHYTAPALLPPTPIRPYPASGALLPVVRISTHPQLSKVQYREKILPHPTLSHQSTTITLPSTHYWLQIAPTISRELSMGRAYKVFVSVNGSRMTQRDTQYQTGDGTRTHVYEGSLASGVNRIEVEVVAAKPNEEKGLDIEKVTVFANLTRP